MPKAWMVHLQQAPISQTNLSQCPALSPLSCLSLITGLVENFAKVRFHKTT